MVLKISNYPIDDHFSGEELNIAFFASGKGTNFENIVNLINQNKLNANIPILICNKPNAIVLKKAKSFGINSKLIDHRKYSSHKEHDQAILEELKNYNIDIIVFGGWMRIATSVLINPYTKSIINLHSSLLPDFKGNNAIEDAYNAYINSGLREQGKNGKTGCTTHFVTKELDAGPTLMQMDLDILPSDTLPELTEKVHELEYTILPESIRCFSKWGG